MSKEVNTLTETQLVGMAKKIIEESWKDMVKKGVVGASMVGMLAGSGAMQSCRGTSHFDQQWSTEVLTWDQRIEKTWQLHDERGDWEGIEDGVGFCFWCGTRCANSGGGWTVCVVFKDKSTGEFIWPQENKRPNDQGLDNEYTSDRIDTNGLTPCGSNSTCGATPDTNEEKQRINMQIKESQLAEALVEVAKRVMKEYYHGDDINIQLSQQEQEIVSAAEQLAAQMTQMGNKAKALDWNTISGGNENFDQASRSNAMWKLGNEMEKGAIAIRHAIRDVKHEPSPYRDMDD